MSTIAVFSDVHANLRAMQAVRQKIELGGYDAVYCLGDLGGYASHPNEAQDEVMAMGCPTVMGNYDDGVGNNLADCGCQYTKPFDVEMSSISFEWTCRATTPGRKVWLRELPREIRFEVGGCRVLLCHGSPRSTVEYLFENRSDGYLQQFASGGVHDAHADVVVFGHTHVPYVRDVGGTVFVNAGSVGRPKDGDPRACFVVLELAGGRVEVQTVRVPYDVEAECADLIEAGLPPYFADYLRTGGHPQGDR